MAEKKHKKYFDYQTLRGISFNSFHSGNAEEEQQFRPHRTVCFLSLWSQILPVNLNASWKLHAELSESL